MTDRDREWKPILDDLQQKNLRRQLRDVDTGAGPRLHLDDQELLNLASNNYLGLATHPRLVRAAQQAAAEFGTGAASSQLVCGHGQVHAALEHELRGFKKAPATLLFSSGYAANVGTLSALGTRRDEIFYDGLNHASLIDGARMTRAMARVYRHGDVDHLEWLLQQPHSGGRRFLVTDGVFSMDGDLAPLPKLADLADQHDLILIVDDAHGTGVLGPEGRGTVAHFGLEDRVALQTGTFSKALGSQGGFVVGSQVMIDVLLNHARSFVYSTALAPPVAAAALAALQLVQEEPQLAQTVQAHATRLAKGLKAKGHTVVGQAPSPMLAVIVEDTTRALTLADTLRERGVFAPAIRPPTVPDGTSRIRLAPTAAHSQEDIDVVIKAFPRRSELA